MNNLLHQILEETKLLCHPNLNTDYEQYVQLVELREALTSALVSKPLLTPQNKEMIREIISCDPVILQHMQRLKDEANEGISRIRSYKKQKSAYDQQYSSEGFMFDKRN
ncbi:hypothetical protein ACFPYJ_28965 [Paenibacillus solisilvae]|uniref:Flagellar protein FliT n=1 Tax=Paenibacillus solisilvae TaxID=2486751 RepID=A0ABW0W4F6_9BACL